MIWLAVGLLAVGLGMLGVVLPLLPTTPFILLAAYAFARSSDRWHRWLMNHKIFGPLIEDWRRNGGLNRRVKIVSLISLAAVFLISLALGASALVLGVQAVVLTASAVFIVTRPAPHPPEEAE
jgi:uncharacterized membrane protein YbaN (DUF454 family)